MDEDDFAFTDFGRDPDRFDPETGNPGIMEVARAIQVWSWCQSKPVSIAAAAAAFRCPPAMVIMAVVAHPWMLIDGESPCDDFARLSIEHEGE